MPRQLRSSSDCCSRVLGDKPRKRRNSDCLEILSGIVGIEGLRKTILDTILSRLSGNGVSIEKLVPALLEHCLPTTTANSRSWQMLLHNPLRVSDRMLSDILGLQIARRNSPYGTLPQQTVVYIRSFHMTVSQLRDVALQFHNNELKYPQVTVWLDWARGMRSEDIIYVRYVGRTNRGALRRHREDLLTRRSGLLAKFFTCIEKMCPTVIDSATLYTFPVRHLHGVREVAQFNEISEQAVIALLGFRFLLNRRYTSTGTWHFQPGNNHRREFQDLGTKTISRLSPSNFHPNSGQCLLEPWAHDIQTYARKHEQSVSIFRNRIHDFPDALKAMMVQQSTSATTHGAFVPLLTVGAGISRQAYHNQETFYGGCSDSANLMKTFLNRLWSWELPHCPRRDYVQSLLSASALPFVNLCPWLKANGEDLGAAADFLKRYILLTKPHILLTLAEKPSSIIASSSLENDGLHSTPFWSRVGQVELICLEGHCCVQIPCFHPGQGRFSVEPKVFLDILDRTLWVVLLTLSVSLDSVELLRAGGREGWCRYVKREVESILLENGFIERFQSLKGRLYKERPKSTATKLTSNRRSNIAIATRTDVDFFIFSGFAVDKAMSERRRQQAYGLWELNISEFHLHISRDNPSAWFQWVNSLEEGKSLFVEAIANAVWASTSSAQLIGHNVPEGAPGGATDSSLLDTATLPEECRNVVDEYLSKQWVSYNDIAEAITIELSKKVPLWEFLHADRISTELSQTGIFRFKAVYRPRLHGAEVIVWRNGSVPMYYWLSPSGQKYKFVMRAPKSSLDISYGEIKYIFFTRDGIDLRDKNGASCLVQKCSLSVNNKVTFPLHRLPNCQDTAEMGNRLLELWESETGLGYWEEMACLPALDQGSTTEEEVLPQGFYSGESLGLIRLNWNEVKLTAYKEPPKPADETWLLWMCAKEHWPDGGLVFIGTPEKWPLRRDNIWVHFREFLSRPAYRHHPKLTQVQAWAHDISYTRKTPQMIKNLKYLCHVTSKRKIQKRDYERVRTEGKDVKIAGTELRIKPNW